MGCLKMAYHIRRVNKLLEEYPDYPIDKTCHIAGEMIGASEWDAEVIMMLMTHCREEAIEWAKKIFVRTKRKIDAIEW